MIAYQQIFRRYLKDDISSRKQIRFVENKTERHRALRKVIHCRFAPVRVYHHSPECSTSLEYNARAIWWFFCLPFSEVISPILLLFILAPANFSLLQETEALAITNGQTSGISLQIGKRGRESPFPPRVTRHSGGEYVMITRAKL
jgi:hypothetical protein